MANGNQAKSGGIGVAGLLGVAFVVLKLTGHIDWDWLWVTAPFWGPLALIASIAALLSLPLAVIAIAEYLRNGKKVG